MLLHFVSSDARPVVMSAGCSLTNGWVGYLESLVCERKSSEDVTAGSLADGGDSPSVTVVTMSQIW